MNTAIRLIFDNGGGTTLHVLADDLLVAAAYYRDATLAARNAVQVLQSGLLPNATERMALALDAATTAPTSQQIRAGQYICQTIDSLDECDEVADSLRLTEWTNAVAFADALHDAYVDALATGIVGALNDASQTPDEPDDQDEPLQRIRDREADQ